MSPLPHLHRHHDDGPDQPAPEPREELRGAALRLTVHLADGEQYHHRPVYSEIVHAAHRAGLAGASVFRGMEGFGRNARTVHTTRLLDVAENLPLLVVLVDTRERIQAFLPRLREISPTSLATLEEVDLVPPAAAAPAPSAPPAPPAEPRRNP
jgi:PII-like signaling protein